jgi:hypothetical protein
LKTNVPERPVANGPPVITGVLARLLSPGPRFNVHTPVAADRERVEHYVSDQFRGIHGATIRDFMPTLITMTCEKGFSAAVGIRPAQGHTLFLEQYLAEPVEKTISRLAGHTVKRGNISEIGNLVATRRGSSQLLFLILTAVLHRTRSEWLVFTATPGVQKSIRRLGFTFYTLGDADPSLLRDSTRLEDWGRYYENRPQVVAGSLSEAMSSLYDRKIFHHLVTCYQETIDALSASINGVHRTY